MSTILNTNGTTLEIPHVESGKGLFHIVTAEWNSDITYALRDGARETLLKAGLVPEEIVLHPVPGTVELVYACAKLAIRPDCRAVIAIGCVIRGDTPHFDYVCMQAAQGIASLNAQGKRPVIFGVLTVDNLQQALDRAGGCLGNKGCEAALAAIAMADFE